MLDRSSIAHAPEMLPVTMSVMSAVTANERRTTSYIGAVEFSLIARRTAGFR
jgi:hypothetical protein